MPGVGKTQLALKYAERHRQNYAAGLWVSAASRETLLSGFAVLAKVLNLPERDEADQEKAAAAVRRWLDTTDQPWLLILDNADEPELLQGFLPSGRWPLPADHPRAGRARLGDAGTSAENGIRRRGVVTVAAGGPP